MLIRGEGLSAFILHASDATYADVYSLPRTSEIGKKSCSIITIRTCWTEVTICVVTCWQTYRHDEFACAMADMDRGWPIIVEARVKFRCSLRRIFVVKIGIGTGFSPCTVVSLLVTSHHNPQTFTYRLSTLYKLRNWCHKLIYRQISL
jgi:hypothetical protein